MMRGHANPDKERGTEGERGEGRGHSKGRRGKDGEGDMYQGYTYKVARQPLTAICYASLNTYNGVVSVDVSIWGCPHYVARLTGSMWTWASLHAHSAGVGH
jgi:hypothetical protein